MQACFSVLAPGSKSGRTRHYVGLPPGLSGGMPVTNLPSAAALLITPDEDGVLLLRLARDGSFAGDTWHEDLGAAQEQAEYEYEGALTDWRDIPEGTTDLEAYVLTRI